MRLAKHLAHAGVASRRAAEQLVFAGRVTVGGEVVRDPARDVGEQRRDRGRRQADRRTPGAARGLPRQQARRRRLDRARHPRPAHESSTSSRATAPLPGRPPRRRHDRADPAHRRRRARLPPHPSVASRCRRVYRAVVRNPPVREPALRRLREGVELEDGRTSPAKVRRIAPNELELTIHEGRKRQVRRMLEAVGHRVETLERVAVRPAAARHLPPGGTGGSPRPR